jgi:CRP-like cAMP-binding protein
METMSKGDRKSLRNSIASSKKFHAVLPYITLKKLEGMTQFIVLEDGKAFGELALINNAPRGATILCMKNSHFAVINKEDFGKTLSAIEK